MFSVITRFIDNVAIYDDYVYLSDWLIVQGIDWDGADQDERESIKEDFYDWAEENGFTAQDC